MVSLANLVATDSGAKKSGRGGGSESSFLLCLAQKFIFTQIECSKNSEERRALLFPAFFSLKTFLVTSSMF